MIKYNITNDLSHLKEGDTTFHTLYGHVVITSVNKDVIVFNATEDVFQSVDTTGRIIDTLKTNPVLFESVVTCVNYFSYYYNYMLNDRTISNKYTGI